MAEDTILQTLAIAFENIDENSSYLIPGINKKIKYKEEFFFIVYAKMIYQLQDLKNYLIL